MSTLPEDDVRRARRLAEVSFIRREMVRLAPRQQVLLQCLHSNDEKQSPIEVYRAFNNIMRLSGRKQISHKRCPNWSLNSSSMGLLRGRMQG